MRVKTLTVADRKRFWGELSILDDLPNFSVNGSVAGMKKHYYGADALLVRCGKYIYNCTSEPKNL
jgi:hypothetical protein